MNGFKSRSAMVWGTEFLDLLSHITDSTSCTLWHRGLWPPQVRLQQLHPAVLWRAWLPPPRFQRTGALSRAEDLGPKPAPEIHREPNSPTVLGKRPQTCGGRAAWNFRNPTVACKRCAGQMSVCPEGRTSAPGCLEGKKSAPLGLEVRVPRQRGLYSSLKG